MNVSSMSIDQPPASIRCTSAVLSTFPWNTDFLLKDLKTAITDDRFSAYIDTIIRLEEAVRSSGGQDLEASRFKAALRITEGPINISKPTDSNRSQSNRLCEMMCAYRLLDVLSLLLEQDTPTYDRPLYPKRRMSEYLPNQFWPLEDWVSLLTKARGSIDTLKRYGSPGQSTDEQSAPQSVSAHSSVPLTLKLFRGLLAVSRTQEAVKVLQNIQLAALHLACMLNGTPDVQSDLLIVPNLPASSGDWMIEAMLSPEEAEFFRSFIRTSEIQKIRHPLYGALLFSPLYLLSHRKLTANAWDQANMLKLSKALGNRKPAILVRTEVLLWQCLMDIATGRSEGYESLTNFFSKVDWDALAMVSDVDRAHFADDEALPLGNQDIVSFEGVTGLSDSWPLYKHRLQLLAAPSASGTSVPTVADAVPGAQPNSDPTSSTDDASMPLDPFPLQQPVQSTSTLNDDGSGNPRPTRTNAVDAALASAKDDKFHSKRLNALDRAGKIPDLSEKPTKPTAPRSRPRRSAQDSRKTGKGAKESGKVDKVQVQRQRTLFVPYQQVQEGVFVQEVRVKTIKKPKVTFKQETVRERVIGTGVEVFDGSGQSHNWIPEFHFPTDLQNFYKLYRHAAACYIDDKPRYISDPENSRIRVLKYADFKLLTASAVQEILRERHILITEHPIELVVPTDSVQFDEAGLQLLKNLETNIPFQDQSIRVRSDYSVQLCNGTLEHVLESARKGGAIINALSFPLPLSEIRKSLFSSDIEAWLVTEGLPYCDQEASYPTADMRWGLAATRGARHYIHVDCDGLGTLVDVVCGGKLWFLYTPGGKYDYTNFGDADHFFYEFDVTRPPSHWDAEVVYLQPGTRLLMKPNTPHAVYTTDHSIAFGGHFYSFGDIQQTFFGIVHAFVMDNLVTNTEHPKTRVLLFRMMQYLYKFYVGGADPKKNAASHLPVLGANMDVFVDLLTLCNYCILSNFLDPRTYNFPGLPYGYPAQATHLLQRQQHDYNALSPDDRHYFSYVRGLAINLIHWVNCHYVFDDEKGRPASFIGLAREYLHGQVRVIVAYKVEAEAARIIGIPNCSEGDLRRQASLLFTTSRMPEFQGLIFSDLSDAESLAWDGDFTPKKRSRVPDFVERDPLVIGTTRGDQMFHAGSATGFPLSRLDDSDANQGEDTEMRSSDDLGTGDGGKSQNDGGRDNESEDEVSEDEENEDEDNEENGNEEGGNEDAEGDADGINEA